MTSVCFAKLSDFIVHILGPKDHIIFSIRNYIFSSSFFIFLIFHGIFLFSLFFFSYYWTCILTPKISKNFPKSAFQLFNRLSANLTKWSSTLKQFVTKLLTNCLSVFDHFVGLVLKRLIQIFSKHIYSFIYLFSIVTQQYFMGHSMSKR